MRRLQEVFRAESGYRAFFLSMTTFALAYGLYKGVIDRFGYKVVMVTDTLVLVIALFGGWIWRELGIETLFVLSAILGLCNSAYAATIKTGKTRV